MGRKALTTDRRGRKLNKRPGYGVAGRTAPDNPAMVDPKQHDYQACLCAMQDKSPHCVWCSSTPAAHVKETV